MMPAGARLEITAESELQGYLVLSLTRMGLSSGLGRVRW